MYIEWWNLIGPIFPKIIERDLDIQRYVVITVLCFARALSCGS